MRTDADATGSVFETTTIEWQYDGGGETIHRREDTRVFDSLETALERFEVESRVLSKVAENNRYKYEASASIVAVDRYNETRITVVSKFFDGFEDENARLDTLLAGI